MGVNRKGTKTKPGLPDDYWQKRCEMQHREIERLRAVVDAARNLFIDAAMDDYPNEINPGMSAKLAPLAHALAAVTKAERTA